MPPYLQGLGIGLAYVAPIGMQNLFVINTALTQPRHKALLTALIVIFFDVTLALACFFGVGALMDRFTWLKMIILLAGGAVVIWIGIGLLKDKPSMDHSVDVDVPLPKVAAKACVVTWFNPQALIDGTLLFGGFRAGNPGAVSTQLILGSSTASFVWFLGITILISFFSARFNDKILRVINIVCGLVILFYGAKLLVLDEATAGLDPVVRGELMDLFLEFIQDERHSIIMSSHITADLEQVADSIAYLHNGQLLFQENKDELLQSYGVLHCSEDVLTSLPAGLVVFTRRGAYGCESLVRERRTVQELLPEAVCDAARLDDIMRFYSGRDAQ